MDGSELLIIFSKAPIAGFVKTRLFPHLSFDEAAELQTAFLRDTVELALERGRGRVCVAYTPAGSLGIFMGLLGGRGVGFLAQEGDDLGARMHNAFMYAFGRGYEKAVIVGSDIPTLTPEALDEAFGSLDGHDLSICPAGDGGYCMIGLRRPLRGLFDGVEWSTPGVLDHTLALAQGFGMSVRVLEAVRDVDTFEDLRSISRGGLHGHTGRMLDTLRPRLEDEGGWLV